MHGFVRGIDAFVHRRRRLVILAWLTALVVAVPFAARQSNHLSGGGYTVPGSASLAVDTLLRRDFPSFDRSPLVAVVVPRRGATMVDVARARARLLQAASADPGVRVAPPAAPLSTTSPTLIPLHTGRGDDQNVDTARRLRERLGLSAQSGPVQMHLVGWGALWSGLSDTSKKDLSSAEAIGFPIVAVILLAVFGSLAAAALPLALGVVSVAVTGALIYLLSLAIDMSVFVTNMASMIGIGVAIDYSLFVLARFREEVRAGRTLDDAQTRATATSGVAVLFSGVTVMLSLAGLWLVPNNAIRSMALGAILVVAVSVLGSATLLPALIRRFGTRVVAPGRIQRRLTSRRGAQPRGGGFWRRWTAAVMRRPVLSVCLSGGLLLLLASPVLAMHTGIGAVKQFPKGDETVAGVRAAASVAPAGAAEPLHVVVTAARRDELARAVAAVTRTVAASRGIVTTQPARYAHDGHAALIVSVTRQSPEAASTKALVTRLRATLPAAAAPANVEVGGGTGGLIDINAMINGSMWKIVLFVLGLSFVVLVLLLRSIVLPLKAVLMNLLSVGAAYGSLVAVFQWGWADTLFGYHSPGSVDWMTPPLVLAVVFGLSMDYEVFLLSRIRERYEATGDTTVAVTEGLASSAQVISSAALIMVAVFAVFVGTGVTSIKEIGLGNAVAIGIDATLVRLVLMPAAMRLFGRWNWWLPRPLERLLHAPPRRPARTEGVLA